MKMGLQPETRRACSPAETRRALANLTNDAGPLKSTSAKLCSLAGHGGRRTPKEVVARCRFWHRVATEKRSDNDPDATCACCSQNMTLAGRVASASMRDGFSARR